VDYSKAYEQEYGKAETVADSISHILETFIKADSGFRREKVNITNTHFRYWLSGKHRPFLKC
jgi:hypothetical protein|tara:strand:+ start:17797 stop:17982 length:186 start_codon:yes stop_codon:yes gene_type:complete